jgi:Uma2 family endonuclease
MLRDMSNAGSRPKTPYRQLEEVPETMVAERIDDVVYATPRPGSLHAQAHLQLAVLLVRGAEGTGGPAARGGGWRVLPEPELHLGARPDVLVPDLAAWRRERMPELPETTAFTLVPDWVCEVLSPSNARMARVQKLRVYARAGVRHVWLVDPREQRVEVLRLEGHHYSLVGSGGGSDRLRGEPFEEFEFPLGELWAR